MASLSAMMSGKKCKTLVRDHPDDLVNEHLGLIA